MRQRQQLAHQDVILGLIHQLAPVGIEGDAFAALSTFGGNRQQTRRQRFAGQADAAEMQDARVVHPAGRQFGRIKMQVGAVVTDEEIIRRRGRCHHRQQWRLVDLLQVAHVEAGFLREYAQFLAKDVAADTAGIAGRDTKARADTGNVPAGAAGQGAPLAAGLANEISEGFAEDDEFDGVGHGCLRVANVLILKNSCCDYLGTQSSCSANCAQYSSVTSPVSQPPRRAPRTASAFLRPPAMAITGLFGGVLSGGVVMRAASGELSIFPSASKAWQINSPTAPCCCSCATSSSSIKPSSCIAPCKAMVPMPRKVTSAFCARPVTI